MMRIPFGVVVMVGMVACAPPGTVAYETNKASLVVELDRVPGSVSAFSVTAEQEDGTRSERRNLQEHVRGGRVDVYFFDLRQDLAARVELAWERGTREVCHVDGVSLRRRAGAVPGSTQPATLVLDASACMARARVPAGMDASMPDAATPDAARDAGQADAGELDAGEDDDGGGRRDGGRRDGGAGDAGGADAGEEDAGEHDAGGDGGARQDASEGPDAGRRRDGGPGEVLLRIEELVERGPAMEQVETVYAAGRLVVTVDGMARGADLPGEDAERLTLLALDDELLDFLEDVGGPCTTGPPHTLRVVTTRANVVRGVTGCTDPALQALVTELEALRLAYLP